MRSRQMHDLVCEREDVCVHSMGQPVLGIYPTWAHDGGNARLVERLQDPATRARIRRDIDDRRKRRGGRKSQSWSLLEYTVHSRRRSRVCKFSPRFTSCPIIPVDALKDAQFPADLESFFDWAVVLVSPKLSMATPLFPRPISFKSEPMDPSYRRVPWRLCVNRRISGATRFGALPLDLAEKRAMRERGMPALQPPAAWRSHRREPGDRGAWFQKASTGRYE